MAVEYVHRATTVYWRGKQEKYNFRKYLLIISPTHYFVCKKCDGDFNINETFIDRAVVHELKRVSFPCYNEKCLWEGSNVDYRVSHRHDQMKA